MSDSRVAIRYATSLFELALEKGLVEEVNNDMQLFEKVGKENREFLLVLKNPIIPHSKKLAVLKALFEGKVNSLTMAIFDISVKKNRETILYTVAKEFHSLYNRFKGVEKAEVTSATPLTDELRIRFKNIVKEKFGKEVELHELVNADLIGGYILKVEDRQIDESIKSKLMDLKREFSYNPYIKEF